MDVCLLDEDCLGVAGDAASEGIGKAKRGAEGQNRHRIGAADCGAERRNRAAHDIRLGIALRHHAPGGLRGDEGGTGLEAAGRFGASP